jgi:uncharacterized RDD family membrane protein YckC
MFLDSTALAPLAWLDQFIWNHTSQSFILLPWTIFDQLIGLAYGIGFVVACGQTPGKMACGVKIFDIRGKSVSLKQAVLRDVVPVLLLLYFLFPQAQNILAGQLANRAYGDFSTFRNLFLALAGWLLLEVITMLTNKKRRAVHDYIAGTVVVREKPKMMLFWWLLVLLILSFIVPHVMQEKNFVGGT